MSYLVIYEETEEVVEYEQCPNPNSFPSYTILYNSSTGEWHRCHSRALMKGNSWVEIALEDEPEIPKSVKAMVLLLS